MSRIALQASHVIGFNGRSHVIWRNGEVVFSGNTILHVGQHFSGEVDQRIDYGSAVIGPGFIDLDALGDLDSTVLCFDNADDWELGRLWREGDTSRPETYTPEEELFKYRYAFTQLIRNGITTALPITSMSYRAWAESYEEFAGVAAIAADLGLRTYLGPCYMSGTTTTDEHGSTGQYWDEDRGLKGLAEAERFIADFDNTGGGLIRAILAPDRIETCTPGLLEGTSRIARDTGVPVRIHCCQSRYEVELVRRLRGKTSYRWLDSLGLLNIQAILPHGIHAHDDDVALLAASGASIAHCPVVFARDGEALNSFASYQARGVNIGMGTDTFPPDMIDNMRQGLNICRVVEGRRDASSAADFYTAATLNGAKALRRDDIGRLSAGAKADITVFDLSGFHLGPFIDPVKTMVLAGSGRDFIDSWIDGRRVMQDRQPADQSLEALRQTGDRQFVKLMASHQARSPRRQPPDELFKPSFPLAS